MWSIAEVARLAGTTSRTLRHYDEIGLLPPTRIGENGYRYYDQAALVVLQRILLLRDLGLGLSAIARVLADETDAPRALEAHLAWLRLEHERLGRQIVSVTQTLSGLTKGTTLMAHEMLDGFDHTQYKAEVEERWGEPAYTRSNDWWGGLTDAQRTAFRAEQSAVAAAFGAAFAHGEPVDGEAAQAIAWRHVAWLAQAAEGSGMPMSAGYIAGLGEMYVADERFGRAYDMHGDGTAEYVRDVLAVYAQRLG